jgi:hypothetical protein
MDEAQELSDDALEALKPTISAGPLGNPQQIYTGTPPGPLANGEVFTRVRAAARAGHDKRLSWLEWSMLPWDAKQADRDALDLDDRRNWAKSNPSQGIRLNVDVIADERSDFSDDGFARERGGVWSIDDENGLISPTAWSALADKKSIAPPLISVAFDVNPERSAGAIGLYGTRPDDLGHVELVDVRPGMDWLLAELIGIARRNTLATPLCCDPRGPAGGLIPDLEAAGVPVLKATAAQVSHACASFLDAVTLSQLRHTGQPQLAKQVSAGRQQDSGDSWRFARKGSTDISGLYAVTLARWAYMTREVPESAPTPSVFFLGSLECADCDCPSQIPEGAECPDCQHIHEPTLEDE